MNVGGGPSKYTFPNYDLHVEQHICLLFSYSSGLYSHNSKLLGRCFQNEAYPVVLLNLSSKENSLFLHTLQ